MSKDDRWEDDRKIYKNKNKKKRKVEIRKARKEKYKINGMW